MKLLKDISVFPQCGSVKKYTSENFECLSCSRGAWVIHSGGIGGVEGLQSPRADTSPLPCQLHWQSTQRQRTLKGNISWSRGQRTGARNWAGAEH